MSGGDSGLSEGVTTLPSTCLICSLKCSGISNGSAGSESHTVLRGREGEREKRKRERDDLSTQ